MLGSVADAEDIVQDVYLRWQRAPEDDIREPRAYLTTIVTRAVRLSETEGGSIFEFDPM